MSPTNRFIFYTGFGLVHRRVSSRVDHYRWLVSGKGFPKESWVCKIDLEAPGQGDIAAGGIEPIFKGKSELAICPYDSDGFYNGGP